MRDPTRGKNARRGRVQVGRALGEGRGVQQVADVIQGHDDHDQAAGEVYGVDSVHARTLKLGLLFIGGHFKFSRKPRRFQKPTRFQWAATI